MSSKRDSNVNRRGTLHAAISRVESGQHMPQLTTLRWITGALHGELLLGFQRIEEPTSSVHSPSFSTTGSPLMRPSRLDGLCRAFPEELPAEVGAFGGPSGAFTGQRPPVACRGR